jgi:hypothetical protein
MCGGALAVLEGLSREAGRIAALLDAIRASRAGLAELMLAQGSETETDAGALGLYALGAAAQELKDSLNEKTI